MEGRKNDQGKLRMDLVPVTAMRAMARGFGYGADKYEAWNWTKGLSTGRLYGALLRHLTAWWDGEEMDQESGLSHLDHVLCCAAMLEGTVTGRLGEDDRPAKTSPAIKQFACTCDWCYEGRKELGEEE